MIAFTELHNEVDFSILPALDDGHDASGVVALERLRARHPGQLVTASYGKPPHLAMHRVSPALGVAQFHVYSYGVLDALQRRIDIRSEGTEGFPNSELRALLRADAPTFAEYGRPAEWKLRATVITDQMLYGYDWIDAGAWDAWLDAHYAEYREVMLREIESRVIAVAEWARWREVPAVVGEGWVAHPARRRLRGGARRPRARRARHPHGARARRVGRRRVLERGPASSDVGGCRVAAPHERARHVSLTDLGGAAAGPSKGWRDDDRSLAVVRPVRPAAAARGTGARRRWPSRPRRRRPRRA